MGNPKPEDHPGAPRLAAIVYEAGSGGSVDVVLTEVARGLEAAGTRLAGAIQHNTPGRDRCRCDMTLEDLSSGARIEISEQRGPEARGCRLNPAALEEIVGLVATAVERGAELLIVNKFGKREAEGRGFRQAIEAALDADMAVLVAVSEENLPAWQAFAAGFDARLPIDRRLIAAWAHHATRPAAGRRSGSLALA